MNARAVGPEVVVTMGDASCTLSYDAALMFKTSLTNAVEKAWHARFLSAIAPYKMSVDQAKRRSNKKAAKTNFNFVNLKQQKKKGGQDGCNG